MRLNISQIELIIGDSEIIDHMEKLPVLQIFDPIVMCYLDSVSKILLTSPEVKQYPDVITFGFWCRKASILGMKKQYENEKNRLGKGVVFHIAPSNVPVNFAYSFVVGLLSGNANIVRVPSKDFEQVRIICNAFGKAITEDIKPYICFLRYGHDQEITDYLSSICDTRVIWGGDRTIMAIRTSPLSARANEITFADRYSICMIDANEYLQEINKKKVAVGFYNDTYLSDQNACTSPRIVIWLGDHIEEAQKIFWKELHSVVLEKYSLQPIKAVNKLANLCKLAVCDNHLILNDYEDNYIVKIMVDELNDSLMDYKGNCGFFFEYHANDMKEILPLCSLRCQTISYYGIEKELINNFINKFKPRGVDRIVPIGRTMDFSLIWDGYDIIHSLSRKYDVL